MPHREITWDAIYEAIRSATQPTEVIYSKVIKANEAQRLVWVKELGDQAIPIVGFTYTVKYYDDSGDGLNTPAAGNPLPNKVKVKKVKKILPDMPEVGQTVVILRTFGSGRLPKCVGVILSPGGFQAG